MKDNLRLHLRSGDITWPPRLSKLAGLRGSETENNPKTPENPIIMFVKYYDLRSYDKSTTIYCLETFTRLRNVVYARILLETGKLTEQWKFLIFILALSNKSEVLPEISKCPLTKYKHSWHICSNESLAQHGYSLYLSIWQFTLELLEFYC